MNINAKQYLTVVFGDSTAQSILEQYEFKFYLYGLDVRSKDGGAWVYVNTGISSIKVCAGEITSDNQLLLTKRITAGIKKVDKSANLAATVVLTPSGATLTSYGVDSNFLTFDQLNGVKTLLVKGEVVQAIKYVRIALQCGLKEAKDLCDLIKSQGYYAHSVEAVEDAVKDVLTEDILTEAAQLGVQLSATFKAKAKKSILPKSDTPSKLVDATEIGQPVQGSSGGSVYYAIGISPTVKMAARLINGKLSVRVEGKPSPQERQALESMNISKAGENHWSTHFNLGVIPLSRVIGAILLSSTIEFEQVVKTDKELKKAVGVA